MNNWPAYLPIWSDPERLGGAPCFINTRVPVEALFGNLEDGMNLDEFLDAFHGVKREDAIARSARPLRATAAAKASCR